jgi:fermentation-respiration switch protein FrsA (DUF1100 family)
VKHLPPLLELHGDADHNVPLAQGEELVKLAKMAGAEAELVRYPGKAMASIFRKATRWLPTRSTASCVSFKPD